MLVTHTHNEEGVLVIISKCNADTNDDDKIITTTFGTWNHQHTSCTLDIYCINYFVNSDSQAITLFTQC